MHNHTVNDNWKLQRLNTLYSLLGSDPSGATVHLLTGKHNFETGYFVSTYNLAKYPNLASINVHELWTEIPEFPLSNTYIGAWLNPETNSYEIDFVAMCNDKETAYLLGKVFEQEYDYDIANKQAVKISDLKKI